MEPFLSQHARHAGLHDIGRGRSKKHKKRKKQGRDVRGMTSSRRAASPGPGAAFVAHSDKAVKQRSRERTHDGPRLSGANCEPLEVKRQQESRDRSRSRLAQTAFTERHRGDSLARDQRQRKRRRVDRQRYRGADDHFVGDAQLLANRPHRRTHSRSLSRRSYDRSLSPRGIAFQQESQRVSRLQDRVEEVARSPPRRRSPPPPPRSRPHPSLEPRGHYNRSGQRRGRSPTPQAPLFRGSVSPEGQYFDDRPPSYVRHRSNVRPGASSSHSHRRDSRPQSGTRSPPSFHPSERPYSPAREYWGRGSPVANSRRPSPSRHFSRSPGAYRLKGRYEGGSERDSRLPERKRPTSGANNVGINMAARGGFRGNFPPQGPSPHHGRHQAPQGPQGADPRRFSQASGHGTPNSSYQGSPPSQSPFSASGRSWSGQQQISPQHGHQQGHFPQGGPYPPTGPGGQYHSQPNQGFSSSYGPPTGPAAQQYPSGPSNRGSFRGGRGGPGNGFGPGRGSLRGGGYRASHLNIGSQPGSVRSHTGQSDVLEPSSRSRSPTVAASHNGDDHRTDLSDLDTDDRGAYRSPRELAIEGGDPSQRAEEAEMPPPNRPPPTAPTGPQASKFSFAFKGPSKPTGVAPKPDISSKFNAAPQRRENGVSAQEDRIIRDLPRSVPTGPASARPRGQESRHQQHSDQHQQLHPETSPRTRKVKKTMKRPKPRPKLPAELAASDSVYFRKPGNESVIGSGTYGKVFKGLNVYTKKLVALKKIRMEGERDGFPVTAVREIKLLQSLKHINIVNLQEVMVEKNDCFMVFEYMSHYLTGLLNHPSFKLDPAQKKHLSKQLFEGLDYLHNRGVLHRDIKAANILVSSEGILKLADFGLARFYAKRHQLDYTNRVITIWYRSPELLLGETQYGPAVDIWSAACVLVEVFTRHPIFPGDGGEISQLDKIYAILGTPHKSEWPNLVEMPWFELLRPGYRKPNIFAEKYRDKTTPEAFDLLAAMFHFDPAKRPSAAEVLQHAYFTSEEPKSRQATELAQIDGDWHEFESKALRKEKERQERQEKEARKMAARDSAAAPASNPPAKDDASAAAIPASAKEQDRDREKGRELGRDRDRDRDRDRGRDRDKERERKRPLEQSQNSGAQRETKRMHVESRPAPPDRMPSAPATATPANVPPSKA